MDSCTDNKVCFILTRQNKQVKVTLEFPRQSDPRAEQEFISRLKAMYLKKIDLSLRSPAVKDKGETRIEQESKDSAPGLIKTAAT